MHGFLPVIDSTTSECACMALPTHVDLFVCLTLPANALVKCGRMWLQHAANHYLLFLTAAVLMAAAECSTTGRRYQTVVSDGNASSVIVIFQLSEQTSLVEAGKAGVRLCILRAL